MALSSSKNELYQLAARTATPPADAMPALRKGCWHPRRTPSVYVPAVRPMLSTNRRAPATPATARWGPRGDFMAGPLRRTPRCATYWPLFRPILRRDEPKGRQRKRVFHFHGALCGSGGLSHPETRTALPGSIHITIGYRYNTGRLRLARVRCKLASTDGTRLARQGASLNNPRVSAAM